MKPGACSCRHRDCHNTTGAITMCGKELPLPRSAAPGLCDECKKARVRSVGYGRTMKPGTCSCRRRNCHNTTGATTKCVKKLPVPRGSASKLCTECAANHIRQNWARNARRYRTKNHEKYLVSRRRYEQLNAERIKKKKKASRKPPSEETRKKDRERYHANLAKNRRRNRASYYRHRLKRMAETRAYYGRQRDLAALGKGIEGGKITAVGDRVVVPKGGRPVENDRAAMVMELRGQGMRWDAVRERVEAKFHVHTTSKALYQLQNRFLERQKKEQL
jgi:hypothetical protein